MSSENTSSGNRTERDRKWSPNLPAGTLGCSFPGCENCQFGDNEYGYCDYHLMPIDGRADPYRDAAVFIGDDV